MSSSKTASLKAKWNGCRPLAADMVRLGVDVIVTGNHANAVAPLKANPG
jgi:hypothetical protein